MVGELFLLHAQERDEDEEEHDVEDALQRRPVHASPVLPLPQLHRVETKTASAKPATQHNTHTQVKKTKHHQVVSQLGECLHDNRPPAFPPLISIAVTSTVITIIIITTTTVVVDTDQYLVLIVVLAIPSIVLHTRIDWLLVAADRAYGLGQSGQQLLERAVARRRVFACEQRLAAHGAGVRLGECRVEARVAEALAAAGREHGPLQRVEADGTFPDQEAATAGGGGGAFAGVVVACAW